MEPTHGKGRKDTAHQAHGTEHTEQRSAHQAHGTEHTEHTALGTILLRLYNDGRFSR